MIGTRLKALQTTNPPKEPNAYLTWINNYVADDYAEAVQTGRGMLFPWCRIAMAHSHADSTTALIERHAVHQSPKRVDELVKIFIHATKVSWNRSSLACL